MLRSGSKAKTPMRGLLPAKLHKLGTFIITKARYLISDMQRKWLLLMVLYLEKESEPVTVLSEEETAIELQIAVLEKRGNATITKVAKCMGRSRSSSSTTTTTTTTTLLLLLLLVLVSSTNEEHKPDAVDDERKCLCCSCSNQKLAHSMFTQLSLSEGARVSRARKIRTKVLF